MVATVGLIGNTDLLRWFTLSNVIIFFSQFFILEKLSVKEDGFWALLHFANIELTVYVIMFWVKKRNENMERIKRTIMELKEVENSKDDFLSNVSHEIRTPINSIIGLNELILRENPCLVFSFRFFVLVYTESGANFASLFGLGDLKNGYITKFKIL